jgi:Fasciclin domain
MALYENDWFSSQTDPIPGYKGFQESLTRLPTVTPDSIFDKLDMNNFSVFRDIIDRSRYRELLNDLSSKVTVFAFPDDVVPNSLKKTFKFLDYGDVNALAQCHIIESVKIPAQLRSANMLIPTRHPLIRIQTHIDSNVIHPWGTSSTQMINILNEGNMFKNGIVIVIDQPIIP